MEEGGGGECEGEEGGCLFNVSLGFWEKGVVGPIKGVGGGGGEGVKGVGGVGVVMV